MRISQTVYLTASGGNGCSYTHTNDCNAYAVSCGNEYLLVDAGCGISTDQMAANLQNDGIPEERIRALLLTHGHLDHSGGAAWLHEHFGIPVFLSSVTAPALEAGDEEAIGLAAAKRAGIYPPGARLAACPVETPLSGGEQWSVGDAAVRVIRAPGHSRDMLAFLIQNSEGLLCFPGDTVFHGGKILLSSVEDCDPAAYATSLRELADLPIDGLYPGHGIWSLQDGRAHLRKCLPYIERMLLPPNFL